MAERLREVRVFISSTFRDMQCERDYLAKFIFPQLRQQCAARGIVFTEVDLRWGITAEQAERGEVVPICLAEVQNCRPFFVGLLGERYGWVPGNLTLDCVQRYPWLTAHAGKSATELEIVAGVLNNPAMMNRACFYFRDPAYAAQRPADEQGVFVESDPRRRAQLTTLKEQIRQSGCVVREPYSTPEELGAWLLRDLTVAVNQEFPPEQHTDARALDNAMHEAFVQRYCAVELERPAEYARLKAYVQGDTPKGFVVSGAEGMGKSALLANWLQSYRTQRPHDCVVAHFVGASPASMNWPNIVQRILQLLQQEFAITDAIPIAPEALRLALPLVLQTASLRALAAGRRIVLVLDGLDQLDDRPRTTERTWLPSSFPPAVRCVISTRPAQLTQANGYDPWDELRLEPLTIDARRALIQRHLARYTKQLDTAMLERLANAPGAGEPLYLWVLLEELRLAGVYEQLPERLAGYLQAGQTSALYQCLLQRWEDDYEHARPNLVRDALTAIWASRRGLQETELRAMLGTQQTPLAQHHWSPLYLAAEHALVNRVGLLSFANTAFRDAVEQRYLRTTAERDQAHARLAAYFEFLPLAVSVAADEAQPSALTIHADTANALRVLDELPWQQRQTKQWDALAETLMLLPLFRAALANERHFEWMYYWQQRRQAEQAGQCAPLPIGERYLERFTELRETEQLQFASTLAQWLQALGEYDTANDLLAFEATHSEGMSEAAVAAGNLNDQGLIARDSGKGRLALQLFREAEQRLDLTNPTADESRLAASILMNRANAERTNGDATLCQPLLERARALMQASTGVTSPEVATVWQSLGNLATHCGDYATALQHHRQAYRLRVAQLGRGHRDVGLSLYNLGVVFSQRSQFHRAATYFAQGRDCLMTVLGADHPYTRSAADAFRQCTTHHNNAGAKRLRTGRLWLVGGTLPEDEHPADPATTHGQRQIRMTLIERLCNAYDDMVGRVYSTPILVLVCPHFDVAVAPVQHDAIAERFWPGCLQWLTIPSGQPGTIESVAYLAVRRQLLAWVEQHQLEVVQVAPFTNSAPFDPVVAQRTPSQPPTAATGWRRWFRAAPAQPTAPVHPTFAIEVVPWSHRVGPLLGVAVHNGQRQTALLTTDHWRAQGYLPKANDAIATGTFYLDVAALKATLQEGGLGSLTILDQWAIPVVAALASIPPAQQHAVMENALRELMRLIPATPMIGPVERGERGYLSDVWVLDE